jgi:hypothetical protein
MQYKTEYDTSFTAGGLLFTEFKALERILLSQNFSELIKIEQEENKVIGIATKAARIRIISQIKNRYNNVSKEFWVSFFKWTSYEQKLGLFYLCLKTYPIVFDLHFQVSVRKQKLGLELTEYDIQMRLDELSSTSLDVESWSDTTIKKINSRYRKAIKDAGMYNGKILNTPEKANLNFWTYFKQTNEQWFINACFIENA